MVAQNPLTAPQAPDPATGAILALHAVLSAPGRSGPALPSWLLDVAVDARDALAGWVGWTGPEPVPSLPAGLVICAVCGDSRQGPWMACKGCGLTYCEDCHDQDAAAQLRLCQPQPDRQAGWQAPALVIDGGEPWEGWPT